MSVVLVSALVPASPIDLPGSFHDPRTIILRPTRRGWGRIGVGGGGGVRCAQPTLLSARFCFLPHRAETLPDIREAGCRFPLRTAPERQLRPPGLVSDRWLPGSS